MLKLHYGKWFFANFVNIPLIWFVLIIMFDLHFFKLNLITFFVYRIKG